MPRATVIETLGSPLSTSTNASYPVWALRDEAIRNRYGPVHSISIEFAMFSKPKDWLHDFNWVQVSFGPEGTVVEADNYITD